MEYGLYEKPQSNVYWNNVNESDVHPALVKKTPVTTKVKIEPTDMMCQKAPEGLCDQTKPLLEEKFLQISAKRSKIPNTLRKDQKKKESTSTCKIVNKKSSELSKEKSKIQAKSNKKEPNNQPKFHPSVKEILKDNPTLKLPKRILGLNISPIVSLYTGEVETYFKKKSLDTNQYSRDVLTFVNKPVDDISEREESIMSFLEKHLKQFSGSGGSISPSNSRKRSSSPDTKFSKHGSKMIILRDVQEETSVEGISKTAEMSTPETVGSPLMVSNEAKTHTIFVCNLCGSVEYSNYMLKTHMTKKHTVCPFCKKRFRSLKTKEDHINNKCVIKRKLDFKDIAAKKEKDEKTLRLGPLQLNASDFFSFNKIKAMLCSSEDNPTGKKTETHFMGYTKPKLDVEKENNPIFNKTQNEIFRNGVSISKNFEIHTVPSNNHKPIDTENNFNIYEVSLTMKHEAELALCTPGTEKHVFDNWTDSSSKNIPNTNSQAKYPLAVNSNNNIIKTNQLPNIRVKSVTEINKMNVF